MLRLIPGREGDGGSQNLGRLGHLWDFALHELSDASSRDCSDKKCVSGNMTFSGRQESRRTDFLVSTEPVVVSHLRTSILKEGLCLQYTSSERPENMFMIL